MRTTILSIILYTFCHGTMACQELIWSAEEYAVNSKSVYVGLVQAVSLPLSKEDIDIEKYANSFRKSVDVNVTIDVIKSLKGENKHKLNIPLNWCGGGQYELGDIVVAYKIGELWHVKNTKEAINQSKTALTNKPSAH